MKKNVFFAVILLLCLTSCHKSIWETLNDLDIRVTKLEELCKEMNTNITAVQTIINVQQSGDYITNVTPIMKNGETIGYTITFANHEPITIYNGEDGRDGKDGSPSSYKPTIGVAKDTDGIYYWTLDGHWLLDDEGNKLRVTGVDGSNGHDGNPGSQGNPGKDGNDGITPQLKIEGGYWYVSYDKGNSWVELGKAVGDKGNPGEPGKDGKDGQDGNDGDSMFKSVTYDENNVYFTLEDGTTLQVPMRNGGNSKNVKIVDGAIMVKYAVSATDSVYFSQGNLQFNAMAGTRTCSTGAIKIGIFRFAEHQYDYIGKDNSNASSSYNGWIDLFEWATSGYHDPDDPTNTVYEPYSRDGNYLPGNRTHGNGPLSSSVELTGQNQNYDWGVFNPIDNGGNLCNQWRTLTKDEWDYLVSHHKGSIITVSGILGYMICPKNWQCPNEISYREGDDNVNNYSMNQFSILNSTGIIFFPFAGRCSGVQYIWSNNSGITSCYWSRTIAQVTSSAYIMPFPKNRKCTPMEMFYSFSVRLVKDAD